MKLYKFNYHKDEKEITDRNVLVISENKEYIDSIDFGHLSDDEIKQVKNIQLEYENKIKPFMKKGFRRFSKHKMENLIKENI